MTLSVRSPIFSHVAMANAMSEGPFGCNPGRTKLAEPSNDRVMRFIRRWSREAATSIHYTPQAPLIWMLAPFT